MGKRVTGTMWDTPGDAVEAAEASAQCVRGNGNGRMNFIMDP